MAWWTIIVIGVVLLGLAGWADRRAARKAGARPTAIGLDELRAKPARLNPQADMAQATTAPAPDGFDPRDYPLSGQSRDDRSPDDRPRTSRPHTGRSRELGIALALTPSMPSLIRTPLPWRLARPLVLACSDPVLDPRELYPVLALARREARPLIIATPNDDGSIGINQASAETIEANALAGVVVLCPLHGSREQIHQLASECSARVVSRADRHADAVRLDDLGKALAIRIEDESILIET